MIAFLVALSALLLSVPFLVPRLGFLVLIAFVPLLCAEEIASETEMKRFWIWHYLTFVLWNAATTFWVCNATVGGGIFAVLANALQMSLIFGLFRWSRKYIHGTLPNLFLMLAWLAWERYYLTWAEISWPWLVLGNAFARTTGWIQWYEYTGTLGGSLWIWAVNLSVYGILMSMGSGRWRRFNWKARFAALGGTLVLLLGPLVLSGALLARERRALDSGIEPGAREQLALGAGTEPGAREQLVLGAGTEPGARFPESLAVVIAQPNFDPYHKFEAMTQAEQTAVLVAQFDDALQNFPPRDSVATPVLLIGPETFTNDILVGDIHASPTYQHFRAFLARHPEANLLFGASTYELIESFSRPSHTARPRGEGQWYESHNSALMIDTSGRADIFHKSKLVVGVESTPYPALFRHVDEWLGGVMGRCIGQPEVSNLIFREYVPVAAAAPVAADVATAVPAAPAAPAAASAVGAAVPAAPVAPVAADVATAVPAVPVVPAVPAGVAGAVSAASAAPARDIPIGCAICYESVYGEYCTEYIRKGARLLTIITNDAWWKDTPGYRQHLSYASLRAIETRRWIARCANTGISAIIDPAGRIVQETSWWQPEVLTGQVGLSDRQTYFVRHGDIVGRFSLFLFILLFLSVLVRAFISRR
jgi:apolipoprotein N-acyltransferase